MKNDRAIFFPYISTLVQEKKIKYDHGILISKLLSGESRGETVLNSVSVPLFLSYKATKLDERKNRGPVSLQVWRD